MQFLQEFFETNTSIIFFGYGLVFFTLGLAIALQSRRHSRLELAHGMGWLAAFGIAHAFVEWGVVFIPIQAVYLSEVAIRFLHSIHVILLALSFTFLFQFGVEMLRERWSKILFLPLVLIVLWLIGLFAFLSVFKLDFDVWLQNAQVWARYLIGFPASICAAFGLRYQADRYIKPAGMSHIYRMLRVAGIFFMVYGFFGGLIVPASSFFPASVLNETMLLQRTGVPVPIFRSLTALVLTLSIIRALDVFDFEVDQIIEQMTLDRNIMMERERIGRELHDNTIQTIYTAGLLIQSTRQKLPADDKNGRRLEKSMDVLNDAIAELRSYISELRPSSEEQILIDAIQDCAGDARWKSVMKVDLQLDLAESAVISSQRTQQLLSILNEALSNAARHGKAHRVLIASESYPDRFRVKILDDGTGFMEADSGGYGLRNMRDRARLIGGHLEIHSTPGKGTEIVLDVPWEVEE